MMNCNIYPDLPKEPLTPPHFVAQAQPGGQVTPHSYRLNIIQSKRQGLLRLGKRYAKKYSKYSRILDRLAWLNACSSGLSVASGMSSVATLSTFIGLPISIPLGAVSLAGASVSGVATVLTSKYQRNSLKS